MSCFGAATFRASFPTAPLTAFIAVQIARGLTAFTVQNAAQIAWQVLSVASGMVSILFLVPRHG